MIIEYIGDEPLTLTEIKIQCKIDDDEENSFLEGVIIPGARAMAEAKTGCAIREARYLDDVTDLANGALSMGGVTEIESVMAGNESVTDYAVITSARRIIVVAAGSYGGKPGAITYRAGVDISLYPSVKSWMLLAAGWLYANRELLYSGQAIQEMPQRYVDSLLLPIDVPAAM